MFSDRPSCGRAWWTGLLETCHHGLNMRWKLRKLMQGIALFVCIVAVNVLYVIIAQGSVERDESSVDHKSPGQVDSGQNGARLVSARNATDLRQKAGHVPDRARRSLENYLPTDRLKDGANESNEFNRKPLDPREAINAFLHSKHTELSDVFITVKTTRKFHEERIQLLLDTWVVMGRDVVSTNRSCSLRSCDQSVKVLSRQVSLFGGTTDAWRTCKACWHQHYRTIYE